MSHPSHPKPAKSANDITMGERWVELIQKGSSNRPLVCPSPMYGVNNVRERRATASHVDRTAKPTADAHVRLNIPIKTGKRKMQTPKAVTMSGTKRCRPESHKAEQPYTTFLVSCDDSVTTMSAHWSPASTIGSHPIRLSPLRICHMLSVTAFPVRDYNTPSG